jgi:hypothetical protein
MDSKEDVHRFRARFVRAVLDNEEARMKGSEYMMFIIEFPNSTVEVFFYVQ